MGTQTSRFSIWMARAELSCLFYVVSHVYKLPKRHKLCTGNKSLLDRQTNMTSKVKTVGLDEDTLDIMQIFNGFQES